jgi:hypothetical protein
MKSWLLRALVAGAIGAYLYRNRKPQGDARPPTADQTAERVAAAGAL